MIHTSMKPINRREFLGKSSCSAMGSLGIYSTLINLKLLGNVSAATATGGDDYRAAVCVFLAGGNDSYNMLIPTDNDGYSNYQQARGSLALPREGEGSVLPLNVSAGSGNFGLHPSMPEIQSLFNQDKLSFLANTGTLIEPTTVVDFQNSSVPLPRALFSHSDQIAHWQTARPELASGQTGSGWFGRLGDLLHPSNAPDSISMGISLSGSNLLQTGKVTIPYAISPNGSIGLHTGNGDPYAVLRASAIRNLVENNHHQVFKKVFTEEIKKSLSDDEVFSSAFSSITNLESNFGSDAGSFGQQLKAVAKTIGARSQLGHCRQTFFVLLGGWDMHSNLLVDHEERLKILSKGLSYFEQSLVDLGVQDKVVTFTASDFGRALRPNNNGSDHAWGGNHIVMGGDVKGRKIFGQYPELLVEDGLDVDGNGRLLPTTSVDQYFAEIALWLGVSPGDLSTVLPNIGNFYSPSSGSAPVGFLLDDA